MPRIERLVDRREGTRMACCLFTFNCRFHFARTTEEGRKTHYRDSHLLQKKVLLTMAFHFCAMCVFVDQRGKNDRERRGYWEEQGTTEINTQICHRKGIKRIDENKFTKNRHLNA